MLNRLLPALLLPALAAGAGSARAADLEGEQSAFLRANAGSPVRWMPWGEAAIRRAKDEQKPVFLFVGSFTSELAAAMRRQTFANPKTAEWLNAHFLCVIVDRDERPDVAALYQDFVSQIRQVNGWPLNIWLTPDFMPYEGATYLSPSEDWGAPGFLKLASQAQAAWANDPAGCRRHATESVGQLASAPAARPPWSAKEADERLGAASAAWMSSFDPKSGGFGDAPKNPETELLRFLLQRAGPEREAALATLRAISASALRDPLDGGFFRYASDAAWRIPYPQKTLADQARFALAYLDGAKGPDAAEFARCARGALDFAVGRLREADGTYAAAVDATGDEYSGYPHPGRRRRSTGNWGRVQRRLSRPPTAWRRTATFPPMTIRPAFSRGKNLLRSCATDSEPSRESTRLLAIRDARPAPPRDERATAEAHGLLLAALARAGARLGEPRYLDAAGRLVATIRSKFLASPQSPLRRFADSETAAGPEDYAAVALGCAEYAAAAHDAPAGSLATRLLDRMDALFYDPAACRFFASPLPLGPGLFLRPVAAGDAPSAVSLALEAGDPHAREIAAALCADLAEESVQGPGDELLGLALYAEGGNPPEAAAR